MHCLAAVSRAYPATSRASPRRSKPETVFTCVHNSVANERFRPDWNRADLDQAVSNHRGPERVKLFGARRDLSPHKRNKTAFVGTGPGLLFFARKCRRSIHRRAAVTSESSGRRKSAAFARRGSPMCISERATATPAPFSNFCAITYYNCGDWVESCSALVENFDGTIELLNFNPFQAPFAADAEEPELAEASL